MKQNKTGENFNIKVPFMVKMLNIMKHHAAIIFAFSIFYQIIPCSKYTKKQGRVHVSTYHLPCFQMIVFFIDTSSITCILS